VSTPHGTSFPTRARVRAPAAAACATTSPVADTERQSVEGFVARACALYGVRPLPVRIGTLPQPGAGAAYTGGWLWVQPALAQRAETPAVRAILAHEVSHYLLHHDMRPLGGAALQNMGDWAVQQFPKELDANAKGVEVLERVELWSERTAYLTMFEYLRAVARRQQRGGVPAPGHLSACEEIRDLQRRFPAHREAPGAAVPECAATAEQAPGT
jgi:hypothetical protein